MTLTNLFKTPWPWFGGKADAAPAVWAALGDVHHYVEPFAGSLAVLLRRPHDCNRPYYSETVNDLDGLLVNAWRALQLSPHAMAEAASWPVSEADLHARHLALLRWRSDRQLEHLMGDPSFHDPLMAGWWAWGQSCWIGSGWCSGGGSWHVGVDGRIEKRARSPGGMGKRQRPHIGNNGQGVNHAGAREPGVDRKRPHLSHDGQGVNAPLGREQGVARQLPFIGNDGRGTNHAHAREPGVARQVPDLHSDGRGTNHPHAREQGVALKRPAIGNDGRGVNRPAVKAPGITDADEFHPMTMPELRRWFAFLSARLRHVRILNGDWKRLVTNGATITVPVQQGKGPCGVFLDPPYGTSAERSAGLYSVDDLGVAEAAAAWAKEHGEDRRYRIVLAGFAGEHDGLEAEGWRAVEWFRSGFLRGGMGNTGAGEEGEEHHQQRRERLWLSPHCLRPDEAKPDPQMTLFGGFEAEEEGE